MNPAFFDYLPAARDAGLSNDQIRLLYSAILKDYRGDQMLAELRMLRTCLAIQSGHATYEQAMHDNAA
jgi:hypothetical protein